MELEYLNNDNRLNDLIILKKNGKLIIFEPYSSVLLQLATLVMKHEGFDFTVNVWDEKNPKSDEKDVWAGNIAVPNLIFVFSLNNSNLSLNRFDVYKTHNYL